MASKYTFFLHMNATKHWLRLSRDARGQFFDSILKQMESSYPDVSLRLFDVEAFSGKCSDIAMFESDSIERYYHLVEMFRDTEIYTKPYFEIVDIFPGIENGFVEYENGLEKGR